MYICVKFFYVYSFFYEYLEKKIVYGEYFKKLILFDSFGAVGWFGKVGDFCNLVELWGLVCG